ncbi:MAG TPA: adenylate/guanylate cyclase domain-containing protein, partial [Gaiellaceae bacterium]|nr:adenylate/guanylate cyclase domain-containing protein [Gaiellaceae bacterium]
MQVCPNCGEENPPRFRLCGFCGTPLVVELPAQEVRKTVSIVFSDLKGSTSLGESVDSEALREVLGRYFEEMKAVLELHGGRVEKYIGDAIMAVFGLPKVHEDDAIRAVRAAAEMQAALARLNDELHERWGVRLENRTGVNTGEVVAGDPTLGQRLVTGDTVNVTARLEQAAPALEVLVGEPTYRLVRDAVEVEPVEPLELKGKAERVPAYRLISVKSVDEVDRRRDSALVGRTEELETLAAELDLVRSDGATRTVTLLAQAGVGKSRLIDEFSRSVGGVQVLRGRCLPYGRGITFWPVVEIVKQAAGIDESDTPRAAYAKIAALAGDEGAEIAERVASAVGLADGQFAIDELFWAIRRLLAGLTGGGPLVVVFEDIHWAEATLLDLIEYLGEGGGLEALVVCASRPDIAEIRAGWGLKPGHSLLELRPLSDEESALVIANLLGDTGLDAEVAERITTSAEGNPLYVEQLLSMLIDDGILRREDGRWVSTADVADLAIPPTIHALLAARLDLLSREERAVVDPASVIGLVFWQPAVEALVADAVRAEVPAHLSGLCRRQLVRREPSDVDAFRFHHILVKDAAYQALLKRTRAAYHEQFADWAERVNRERDRETEYEEILGYHLEQAHHYLAELGPLDDHGRGLGRRAADKLSSAGRRAFQRGDMPAAANLLRRAADMLPEEDAARLALLPMLGEALTEIGEFPWAQLFLDEAAEQATKRGDDRLGAEAALTLLFLQRHTGAGDDFAAAVLDEANRALPVFERAGDDSGLAKAWRLIMNARGTAYHFAEAAEAAERARHHARLAGDVRQEARAASGLAMAAFHGPTPVAEAIQRCNEILGQRLGDRQLDGILMRLLAPLNAMRGDFDEARALYGRARATFEEMGATILTATVSLDAALVELLAGEPEAAERELRRDYEVLDRLHETYVRSTVAAYLARVLCAQGRFEEAEPFAAIAEEVTGGDDVVSQALWRSVRASLLAYAGRFAEAVQHANAAVAVLRSTDGVLKQADTLVVLAEVLQAAGRPDESGAAAAEALGLYEAKGNV